MSDYVNWRNASLAGTAVEKLHRQNMYENKKVCVSLDINTESELPDEYIAIAKRSFTSENNNFTFNIVSKGDNRLTFRLDYNNDMSNFYYAAYTVAFYCGESLSPFSLPMVLTNDHVETAFISFDSIKTHSNKKTNKCTVYCLLTLYTHKSKSNLCEDIYAFYNRDETKDIKLIVQDNKTAYTYANKFVLGLASPVFFAKFYGKLSLKDDAIIIKTKSLDAIKILVKFCYQAPYSVWKKDIINLEIAFSLLQLAAEYQLTLLFEQLCSDLINFAIPSIQEVKLIKEIMVFAKLFIPASLLTNKKLVMGQIIAAEWANGQYYPAKIIKVNNNNSLVVVFFQDQVEHTTSMSQIRECPKSDLGEMKFCDGEEIMKIEEVKEDLSNFLSNNAITLYKNCTEFLCKHIEIVSSII